MRRAAPTLPAIAVVSRCKSKEISIAARKSATTTKILVEGPAITCSVTINEDAKRKATTVPSHCQSSHTKAAKNERNGAK